MTEPDVILRAPRDGDEGVLYRALTDLDTWEERSPRQPRPVSREEFVEQLTKRRSDESGAEFIIETAGRAVGRCVLFGVDALAQHAEVGISLVAEECGRGVGTAAMRELVAFAFVRWNLHRVVLGVIESNAAAIASYRKVGFVEEGRLREHCWVRGRWEDEVRMGLLRDEWQAGR